MPERNINAECAGRVGTDIICMADPMWAQTVVLARYSEIKTLRYRSIIGPFVKEGNSKWRTYYFTVAVNQCHFVFVDTKAVRATSHGERHKVGVDLRCAFAKSTLGAQLLLTNKICTTEIDFSIITLQNIETVPRPEVIVLSRGLWLC